MIQVESLTKRYGAVSAVDRISFSIGQGEIVGFLGPDGAGKTTTMRILATYLTPTSGQGALVRPLMCSTTRWRCAGWSATCRKTYRSIPRCGYASFSTTGRG